MNTSTLGDLAHPRVVAALAALKELSSGGDTGGHDDAVGNSMEAQSAEPGDGLGEQGQRENIVARLAAVVDTLRPRDADDSELAEDRFTVLCEALERDQNLRCSLRNSLVQLFAQKKQVGFFADTGILPNSGFFSELRRRLIHRVFPAISDAGSLQDNMNQIFRHRDDAIWLDNISVALKLRFWAALQFDDVADDVADGGAANGETKRINDSHGDAPNYNAQASTLAKHALAFEAMLGDSLSQMLDACDVLAIRIGAMGLEPELMRLYPRAATSSEVRHSPFVALAVEAQQLSAAYRRYLADGESPADDERQLWVLIDQCRDVIERVRARAASVGTSLSLTYLLRRLDQSLLRLETIVRMLAARHEAHHDLAGKASMADIAAAQVPSLPAQWARFLSHVVEGEGQRQGIREHISRTIGLLALRVTDNASRAGEHYITTTSEEYRQLWRAAMGAGFIVGFMALLKVYASHAALAPLGYFAAYATIYAFGFMLIHVLHLTLATKQPAMTAATIANAIGEIGGNARNSNNEHSNTQSKAKARDVEKLATLVVDLIRSQIAAILGNVCIAIPTAVLISVVIASVSGQPLMSAEKAQKLIHDVSPFESMALFHAAIAGVCLFIAGLISGYYDNLAAYERIRERLEHAHWLQAMFGQVRLARLAAYLDNNLGALAGNFFLGVMLALVGTVGFLIGLPIDVRHVTLSSANVGLALAALNFSVDVLTVGKIMLGIGLVGLINLSVSFALALWVAMRSRGVGFGQTRLLVAILWARLTIMPKQFFWPVDAAATTVDVEKTR